MGPYHDLDDTPTGPGYGISCGWQPDEVRALATRGRLPILWQIAQRSIAQEKEFTEARRYYQPMAKKLIIHARNITALRASFDSLNGIPSWSPSKKSISWPIHKLQISTGDAVNDGLTSSHL